MYNKPLESATLVAVPPGGKSVELDPNPKLFKKIIIIIITIKGYTI
jgi:hypothetical protein